MACRPAKELDVLCTHQHQPGGRVSLLGEGGNVGWEWVARTGIPVARPVRNARSLELFENVRLPKRVSDKPLM